MNDLVSIYNPPGRFPLGGGSIARATIAFMQAQDTTGFNAATTTFVASVLDFYRYENPLVATAFETEVVASTFTVGAGYVRLGISAVEWRQQLDWYLDSANGNDENVGTALLPVKTIREWWRRTGGRFRQNNTTLHLVGANNANTWPATDPFEYGVGPDQATSAGFSFIIQGTYSVVRSGTFSAAATNEVTATSTPPQATDAATASWAADVGRLIKSTSGAVSGAVTSILRNVAAGVVETTRWTNPATSTAPAQTAPPATLTTYDVVEGTSGSWQGYTVGSCNLIFDALKLSIAVTTLRQNMPATRQYFVGCQISNWTAAATIGGNFFGCCVVTTQLFAEQGFFIFTTCGFASGADVFSLRGANVQMIDCVGEAVTFAAGCHKSQLAGGFMALVNPGVFRAAVTATNTVGAGIQAYYGGCLTLGTAAYGSANAVGARAGMGGRITMNAAFTPTITGTIEISIDGTALQMPALSASAGLVLPVRANCRTWAELAGAPFGGNCYSSDFGSFIGSAF